MDAKVWLCLLWSTFHGCQPARTLTWFPCFSFTRLSKHFRKWGCTASRLQSLQCNTSLYAETLAIWIGISSCHISQIFTICFSHLPNLFEISKWLKLLELRIVGWYLNIKQLLHSLFCSFWFWQKIHAKNGNCITPYYAEIGHVAWLKQHPFFWYPSFSRCGVGG